MITLVWVLMLIVCFNFILKQTYREVFSIAITAVIAGLFVGLMWPYAIEQSKSQISIWLENTDLMLNLSVILTIEVSLQMAFCMLTARINTTGVIGKRTFWIYRFLCWFPGLLIFPVLFSLLVYLIFQFPGTSFTLISWGLAGLVVVLIPLGTYFLHWAFPHRYMRLELLFLMNALIAILGVFATVNGKTTIKSIDTVDWIAFVGTLIVLFVGGIIGLLLWYYKQKNCIRNNKL